MGTLSVDLQRPKYQFVWSYLTSKDTPIYVKLVTLVRKQENAVKMVFFLDHDPVLESDNDCVPDPDRGSDPDLDFGSYHDQWSSSSQ